MKIKFRIFQGIAGDLQKLLIGESESGLSISRLYNDTGIFRLRNLRRAKKEILKEFELLTGKKTFENE
jgi:hypothetical protein